MLPFGFRFLIICCHRRTESDSRIQTYRYNMQQGAVLEREMYTVEVHPTSEWKLDAEANGQTSSTTAMVFT